ncbi:MAG TPA: Clp protease N-terminal domain-containing protein [Streptosporangiaceae bacterium]
MPKINVYLPDDLADAVREMGVPVSAICQRALEASVRRVTAVRQATLGPVPLDDPAGRMAHFTAKARRAVGLAVRSASASGSDTVGTEHLLTGLLADDTNLAMVVLTSMEIEPAAIGQALATAGVTAAAAEAAAVPAGTGADAEAASGGALHFSGPAANALELAVTEAISLGHNYVGCEHVLLGLATETEGIGGATLRDLGADSRPVRRAVTAALAGYTAISASKQARAQAASPANQPGPPGAGPMLTLLREAVRREMQPFTERLERLEERLGPQGDQP